MLSRKITYKDEHLGEMMVFECPHSRTMSSYVSIDTRGRSEFSAKPGYVLSLAAVLDVTGKKYILDPA